MKIRKTFWLLAPVAMILVISSNAFANDGCSSCKNNNLFPSKYNSIGSPNGNLSAGFGTGSRQASVTTNDIELLAGKLLNEIDSEMKSSQNYRNYLTDAYDVVQISRRLRQAEANQASSDQVLAEVKAMVVPLRRMNDAMVRETQARRSLSALYETGYSLKEYTQTIQNGMASGSVQPRRFTSPQSLTSSIPEEMKGVALLPPNEQAAALAQKTCPVTAAPLGSMGKPIRVTVANRSIFVCCNSCINAVKKNPEKYLASLPSQNRFQPAQNTSSRVSVPAEMEGVALLPMSEQTAALRQRTCPVNGEPLGSMGKPIKVEVSGRTVFVCCQGCVNAVKKNPAKYLL